MIVHSHPSATPFVTLTAIWFGMMAAMMAPAVWPWVRSYHRFSATTGPAAVASTIAFATGYLAVWLAYSAAAAFAQGHLRGIASFGSAIFLAAGLYQFAPFKRACLTHCRSPFGYFLSRWRNGPAGGFQMGAQHGAYCVGCCWALMATSLAVGAMSLWWMAALGATAFIEQTSPYGNPVRRAVGVALVVAAVFVLPSSGL